jgi:5-methylcytosine-specific restriction endonuclease McrA
MSDSDSIVKVSKKLGGRDKWFEKRRKKLKIPPREAKDTSSEIKPSKNDVAAFYRLINAEKMKAWRDAWRLANPENTAIASNNRRSRKLSSAGRGHLSSGLTLKLYELQQGKCPCCGDLLGSDYHLDHIMPLALGGSNTDENMQLLRRRCNSQKHSKHPIDFMQERGFLL